MEQASMLMGAGAPIIVIFLIVLALLSFLMPFFVWRASSDIREIRKMLISMDLPRSSQIQRLTEFMIKQPQIEAPKGRIDSKV